jgi:hypothetical protein
MLVSDVIARAILALNDPGELRWPQVDKIKYLNDGVLAVGTVRPDALAKNADFTAVAGTKQTIPADGIRLLDVLRNVGGNAVTYVDRAVLDSQLPSWPTTTQKTIIKHWMYENSNPKIFHVYPPAKLGAAIEIVYSATPAPVTALTNTVPLDDIYINPLVEFVLYKCYSIDTEFSRQPQVAGAHMNAFAMMLGQKTNRDMVFSPDMNQRGAAPNMAITQGGL